MRKTRVGSLATSFLAVCLVFNLSVVPPAMAEAGSEAGAKPASGGGGLQSRPDPQVDPSAEAPSSAQPKDDAEAKPEGGAEPEHDPRSANSLSSTSEPPEQPQPKDIPHQAGDFTVTGDTSAYSYSSNTLTVTGSAPLSISGTTTTDHIAIDSNVTANVTLDGVSIDVSQNSGACALEVKSGATLNLTLASGTDNSAKSSHNVAGIEVPTGAALSIDGLGSLTATGGTICLTVRT